MVVVYNPYIVIPLATWAVAQVTKFAIAGFKGDINFRHLYASGGMPSVHAAVVCSLATTALLLSGVESAIFGVTAIFAAIVMYDSLGVRRSAGEQAVALNMVLEGLEQGRIKLDRNGIRVREVLGHSPYQVGAGALLGIALAGLFNYGKLTPLTDWLQVTPSHVELWVYAGIFGVLVLGGIIAKLILDARYPKSKVVKKLSNRILTATQTIGWLGVISVVFSYEHASYAGWRLWSTLLLIVGVVWGITIFTTSYKTVPQGLAIEQHEARKLKWLNFGKKKRK